MGGGRCNQFGWSGDEGTFGRLGKRGVGGQGLEGGGALAGKRVFVERICRGITPRKETGQAKHLGKELPHSEPLGALCSEKLRGQLCVKGRRWGKGRNKEDVKKENRGHIGTMVCL